MPLQTRSASRGRSPGRGTSGAERGRGEAKEGEPGRTAGAATLRRSGMRGPAEAPHASARARDVVGGGTPAEADAGAEVGATEALSRAVADEGGGGSPEKCLACEEAGVSAQLSEVRERPHAVGPRSVDGEARRVAEAAAEEARAGQAAAEERILAMLARWVAAAQVDPHLAAAVLDADPLCYPAADASVGAELAEAAAEAAAAVASSAQEGAKGCAAEEAARKAVGREDRLRLEPPQRLDEAAAASAAAGAAVAATGKTAVKWQLTPGALTAAAAASKPTPRASAAAGAGASDPTSDVSKPAPGALSSSAVASSSAAAASQPALDATAGATSGATFRSRGSHTAQRPKNPGGWVLALQQGNSSRCAVDVRSGTPPAGGLVGLSCCAGGAAYGGLERRTGSRQLGLAAESAALKPAPGALAAASALKPTPSRPAGPTAVAEPKPAPGARSEWHLQRSDRVPLARSEHHGRLPGRAASVPSTCFASNGASTAIESPGRAASCALGATIEYPWCAVSVVGECLGAQRSSRARASPPTAQAPRSSLQGAQRAAPWVLRSSTLGVR